MAQLGNTYTGRFIDIPDHLTSNHLYYSWDSKELYGFNEDKTPYLLAPNPYLKSAAFSGVDTKTLTLTLTNDTIVTASWDPTIEVLEDAENGNSFLLREGLNTESGWAGENVVLGHYNTITYGWGNFISGSAHQLEGNSATIGGYGNTIENDIWGSIVNGSYNVNRTNYSAIFGYNNQDRHPAGGSMNYPDGGNVIGGFNNYVNDGMAMGMFGSGHIQTGNNVLVAGQSSINLNGAPRSVNQAGDARFIVGNGTIVAGSYARQTPSNAFVVYHSGLVVAPTLTSTLIDSNSRSLITREYLTSKLGTATTVSSTNTNPDTHNIATINGTTIKETITKLNQPVLDGNNLILKFFNENGVEQTVSVDLGTLVTNDSYINNSDYDAAQNKITLTRNDGQQFVINLSEFSILNSTDANGVTTLTQESVVKLTVSKVGQSGQWADILGKPSFYSGWDIGVEGIYSTIGDGDNINIVGSGATTVSKSGNTITISSTDTAGGGSDGNNYLNGVTGSANGTMTFSRSGLTNITFNSTHNHDWSEINNKPSFYSGWNLGANGSYTPIDTGENVNFVGSGATTVSRSGNTITISSTDTAGGGSDGNNYLTGVSGSANGTMTFSRSGLSNINFNASHDHDDETVDITSDTTLSLAHKGKTLLCGTTVTITIPSGLGNSFSCNFINTNTSTGVVTIVGGTGVSLKAPHGKKLLADYTCNIIKRTGAETYHLQGELTP
jgi:hypothetical protein